MRERILDDLKLIRASFRSSCFDYVFREMIKDAVEFYEISLYGDLDYENVPWRLPVPKWDGKLASEYEQEELARLVYTKLLADLSELREMERKTYVDRKVFDCLKGAVEHLEGTYDKEYAWPERY